jgi:hypothetical protein
MKFPSLNLSEYIEKEIISARFILALAATALFGFAKMDITVYGIIIAFYFGNHPATVAAANVAKEKMSLAMIEESTQKDEVLPL